MEGVNACGFSFRYPDGTFGVGPLDWHVDEGSFQLLVGATGSGKTTLLRCLKPSVAPSGKRTGTLCALGHPVDELDVREEASLVGYVAQDPESQIVCDVVWHELAFGLENLGVPLDEMHRRVAEIAHFFGIEPWFRRAICELSGGQKQMVVLASVLAMKPRLLVLDEPTAQLDPVAEKSFLHALFRVNRELGITVVVATHAPEAMVAYATDAVELTCGRMVDAPLERFAPRPLVLPMPPAKPPFSSEAAISLCDVHVRYQRDDDWVLRGLDLDVRAGSIHTLVGGNGCGKTTLLRTVAGVLKPDRGRVSNRLVARQALLLQDPKTLFVCDTVGDELHEWQPVCGYTSEDVMAMLARFGLVERTQSHPFDLSGGQQQCLAFIKLLLTRPDLLLLDEPTKGLDAPSKLMVARGLVAFASAGGTVIIATHDLTFAALVSEAITIIFDGEAATTQPAAQFFAENLFYRPVEDAFAQLVTKEGL